MKKNSFIRKVVNEEITKFINRQGNNISDAFADQDMVKTEQLPNGEIIVDME